MALWTWGANSHGQLGVGTANEQVEKPTNVEIHLYDSKIKQIACGGGHTLLIDDEGKLYSCGWNSKLQLARDTAVHNIDRTWSLSGVTFTNIVCGWDFSCGVTDDQTIIVWGSNAYGQLGMPTTPKEYFSEIMKPKRLPVHAILVSMGLRHTAIVNSKGEVWTTGCGKHGQLGLGSEILSSDRFQKVQGVGKISHLACGQNHTVAWCSEERALYVWGDNRHGQLLLCSEKYKKVFKPNKIDIGVKQEVKKLLSGWTNVLLWLEDGSLLSWGRNNWGQLGTDKIVIPGTFTHIKLPGHGWSTGVPKFIQIPSAVPKNSIILWLILAWPPSGILVLITQTIYGRQVQDVALGSEHTICLATDNTLWAWGWNEHFNTGIDLGNQILQPTLVPLEIDKNLKITQIYAGGAQNFVVIEK